MVDLFNRMLPQVKNCKHLHTSPCIILRREAKPSHQFMPTGRQLLRAVGSYPSLFPFLPALLLPLPFLPSFISYLPFLFSLPYPPLPCPSLPSFPSFLASFPLTLLLLFLYFEIAIHAVATISIGSQVGCIARWLKGHGTYDITSAF